MPETAEAVRPPEHGDRRPDYGISLEPVGKRVRVEFGGEVVAESDGTLLLRETRHVPVYYFPRRDVRMELLHRSEEKTHCPFKGNAAYWTVEAGGRTAENAAWSYEKPFEEVARLKDYISFYWNRMSDWFEDGEKVFVPDRDQAPRDANPLMEWLLGEASHSTSTPDLFKKFCDCLVESGIPVIRIRLVIRTLHPQIFARAYSWERDEDEISELREPYSILKSSKFLESPYVDIFDGAGGVRRRLDIPNPQLDYPILEELAAEGATDYVAMPMIFSDGQINAVSLTTDRPGGFSTGDLGHIYEILPVLSRLFEVHYMRRTAVTLLDTYLGRQTGRRVLNGEIKRGDGDNLHAVIWFCDLRDSTRLTETMEQKAYLGLLDQFLEAMTTAVLDAGGEVLRFIGDAALAIFPTAEDAGSNTPRACTLAIEAAGNAKKRIAEINEIRQANGEETIGFGIALHIGDVMYGNIGSPERLEFTVIGAAANEAARIEAMTKVLGEQILVSNAFRQCYPGELVSLGRHALRGVTEEKELFAPPPEAGDGLSK